MGMTFTGKQIAILRVIEKGNGIDGDGAFLSVDLDELLERLAYDTTKASIQFSLRALVRRGLISKGPQESRRGRNRATLVMTDDGRKAFEIATAPPKPSASPIPSSITFGTETEPELDLDMGADMEPLLDSLALDLGLNPEAAG